MCASGDEICRRRYLGSCSSRDRRTALVLPLREVLRILRLQHVLGDAAHGRSWIWRWSPVGRSALLLVHAQVTHAINTAKGVKDRPASSSICMLRQLLQSSLLVGARSLDCLPQSCDLQVARRLESGKGLRHPSETPLARRLQEYARQKGCVSSRELWVCAEMQLLKRSREMLILKYAKELQITSEGVRERPSTSKLIS